MALLYILENKNGKHYVGITSKSLSERVNKHNRGEVFSTKFFKPWKLIYFERYNTFKEARIREIQIKSWHGGNAFKKLLDRAVGSSNGRIHGSGPWHLGSNPSPTALFKSKFGGMK